jgi:hypothetical protein
MLNEEKRVFYERSTAFAVVCCLVVMNANTASAQALNLNFLDVLKTTAESVADHPIWAVVLALMAFGCLVMYGVTKRVEYLFAIIVPVIMAGAVINWRTLMQSFISGLQL